MSMNLPPIINLNNMIDNEKERSSIIAKINECKVRSETPLIDNQIAYIPTFEDSQIEYMTFDFYRNGISTIVNQYNQCCFKLKYIKFKRMMPRKACKYTCGTWSIDELVKDEVIQPFLLFINGRFVPWDIINISIYYGNYYIFIDASSNNIYAELIRNVKYAQIMTMPPYVIAEPCNGENYNIDDTLLGFNKNGYFNRLKPDYRVISKVDAYKLAWKFFNTNTEVNAFEITDRTDLKLTDKNVIMFTDGLLTTGHRENIKIGFDKEDFDQETGNISRHYISFKVSDEILPENPKVRFDSGLLTIESDLPNEGSIMTFGVFINTNYISNVDNIGKVGIDALAPYVIDQNLGTANYEFLKDLQVPFRMKMDRAKYYDENVANSIKTMMSYNASFFNSIIKESSNLIIETYKGEDIINFSLSSSEYGTWIVPRQHENNFEEYFLMLVNGALYRHSSFAKYKNNTWIVPIQDINPDDTIELLRFQNINNSESDLIVSGADEFKYYSSDIINKDMLLFCKESSENNYEYPTDGYQHFRVEYTIQTDDKGLIKIILNDPFYYGKELTVVNKNRFKHFSYKHIDDTTDTIHIDMGRSLMYCDDYTKYIVFYNGRKLAADNYRLALPSRQGLPFSRFSIYLTKRVEYGDTVDVVYVPSLMKEVDFKNLASSKGDIIIDKSKLGYGLSTYLYMVWINGKKIPESYITDIDSTHIKITTNNESLLYMSIVMYIPEIDVISKAFRENQALWDKVFAQLTTVEICTLLGINEIDITNTDPDFGFSSENIEAVMHELIREEFINNPRVDITEPFVYDYIDIDRSVLDGTDSSSNYIITTGDSNSEENVSDIERLWP